MGRPPLEIKAQLLAGRYRIRYIEEGRWHSTPETDKAKALAWARRNKSRCLDATSKLTLRPFLAGFFAPSGAWAARMHSKRQTVSAKILGDYAAYVRNYLDPLFGDADPRTLTARMIDDAIRDAKGKGGRDLATATRYKICHTFAVIIGDLAEQGIIPANPLLGVRPYSKAPTHPRAALPRESLALLFPATHGAAIRVWGSAMWVACMAILHDTGMRPGEARALRWGEINVPERAIVVRHSIKAGTIDELGETKTGNVRGVRLSVRTLQALAIWRAESRYADDLDFIFTLSGAVPVTGAGIAAAFKAGLRAIGRGSESWTPYWLRHSFVTYALAVLDSGEVSMLAGHSDAVSTGYRHPDDATVIARTRAARGKLD